MRTTFTARRVACAFLGLWAIALVWLFLAPGAFGGSTSYVVTEGVSMQPTFHSGDLALVRAAPVYRVGDVVAYQSHELGTIVLHRIVAHDGQRYVFKGDRNDFIDSEQPTQSQLVGKLWLHAPGIGRGFAYIGSPRIIGFLVGLAALLLAGGAGVASRRKRRTAPSAGPRHLRKRSRPAKTAPSPNPSRTHPVSGQSPSRRRGRPATAAVEAALMAAGILFLAFVVLGLLAFVRRGDSLVPRDVAYSQQGSFSYSGTAPVGDVYPEGRATTGDTVFIHLVDRVRMRFAYHLALDAPQRTTGTASLAAVLESSAGWKRTFQLQAPTGFTGDRTAVSGTLDLPALQALAARVEAATKVTGTTYTLTLLPRVVTSAAVDGATAKTTFAPQLPFTLDALQLRPTLRATAPSLPGDPVSNPLTPSAAGSVEVSTLRPNTIAFPKATVRAGLALEIAIGGLVLSLLALLLCGSLLRRGRGGDESARIRARYSSWLLPVARLDRIPDDEVVAVLAFETLVQIAERSDRLILHEARDGSHTYRITDESIVYVYETTDQREGDVTAPEAEPEPEPVIGVHAPAVAPPPQITAVLLPPPPPAPLQVFEPPPPVPQAAPVTTQVIPQVIAFPEEPPGLRAPPATARGRPLLRSPEEQVRFLEEQQHQAAQQTG